MANYYYVEINSEKLTAALAAEILAFIGKNGGVHNFNYYDGHLDYYTRGLENISEIIRPYNFTDEEVKIEDEFERFWNNLPEEEYKRLCNEACVKTGSGKEIQVDRQSKLSEWG